MTISCSVRVKGYNSKFTVVADENHFGEREMLFSGRPICLLLSTLSDIDIFTKTHTVLCVIRTSGGMSCFVFHIFVRCSLTELCTQQSNHPHVLSLTYLALLPLPALLSSRHQVQPALRYRLANSSDSRHRRSLDFTSMFSMLTRPFARSALAPSSQPSSLHTAAAAAASSTSLFTSATALARALTSASLPATAAARVGPSPASLLAAAANSAIGRSSGVTSSLISNHRRFFTTTNAPAAATSSTTAAPASAAAPVAAATESLWDRARTGFWSSGMKTALTGWTAFATTHTVLSHEPIRERLIAAAGSEGKYRVAFGALAAAIAGTLMFRFWRTPLAQRGPVMHNYAKDKKSLSFALMATLKALGVFCVTDAYVSPVPNPLGITLLGKGIEPTDSRAIHVRHNHQRKTHHVTSLNLRIHDVNELII